MAFDSQWRSIYACICHISLNAPYKFKKKKKGTEKIFEEIILENSPNKGKEIVNEIQEAQKVPYGIKSRRNMPRHILIKLSKIKYKENIKSSKGKATNNIQQNPHKLNS